MSAASLAIGWRQGEAFAFVDQPRFIDLDGEAPRVFVAQSLDLDRQIKPGAKTSPSVRELPLGPYQIAVLRGQRERNAARKAADPAWNPLDLMFPTPEGTIWTQHQIEREWQARMGKDPRTWKELRSAAATSMQLVGVNDSFVQLMLGHGESTTLREHYSAIRAMRGTVKTGLPMAMFGYLLRLAPAADQESLPAPVEAA